MFKKIIVILILWFAASASFAEVLKTLKGKEAYEILNDGKIISSKEHISWHGYDYHVLKDDYFWWCTIAQGVNDKLQPMPSYNFVCYAYEPQ
jgi:hypothetical protein